MSVIVFGSINMDLVCQVPRLPGPGETILGTQFVTTPGGKGANQAVAVAKLGVETHMIGRVGNDGFGQELVAALQAAGVNAGPAAQRILTDPTTHSGVAMITVADGGENQIIGIFGANGQMDDTDVARMAPWLANADLLMLQLEVPLPTVIAAARMARQAGVRVMLDPAPVQTPDLGELWGLVDILLPNEVEAGQLVGFPVTDVASAKRAAAGLRGQGVGTVIVKLGAQGVVCDTGPDCFVLPAFKVDAIDTVAAGDAFAGGLAAALSQGLDISQALVWGSAAGALATTKAGAQVAMADRATFEAFLAGLPTNPS
jgi:ribokinase